MISERVIRAQAFRQFAPCRPEEDFRLAGALTAAVVAACLLVLAPAGAGSAAAATVTVDADRGADTIDIRASAVLVTDAATAWRVLTDYDRYADFIPDLHTSRVVSRHGTTVTVEQSGDAGLWLIKVPISVTFEIDEMAPTRLQSRAIAGGLRELTSCYVLTPVPSGLRMDYVGRVTPRFALFGQIEVAAVERNIARQFQALADEIERQAAEARARQVANAGKP